MNKEESNSYADEHKLESDQQPPSGIFRTSTNPCTHGEAILIVKEMSALITWAYCKYDLMYAFQ